MSGQNRVRILGIDPGLAAVGWGVVDVDGARFVYRGHGFISTKAGSVMGERLALIRDSLLLVIDEYAPSEVAMEALFFSRNVTSALGVAEARGIIRLLCRDKGLTLKEYTPNDVKKAATGSARSGKEEVQNFIRLVLGINFVPKPNHAADALSIALCHGQYRTFCNSSVDT